MLSEKSKLTEKKRLKSLPELPSPITVRLKFRKTGSLQYISHLDLQRTFMRVIIRACIPAWYTKGFNPHAKLVFGVPLSVGTESMCEMADLKIERKIDLEQIKNQLNEQLTDEMYVLEAYYPTTKFNDIAYADYTITLKSDKIGAGDAEKIISLFSSPVTMTKRSKSGEKEVDITAFIKKLDASVDGNVITINTILSAGSQENLNPEYIVTAIKNNCDFFSASADESYRIMRNKVYDKYLVEFK